MLNVSRPGASSLAALGAIMALLEFFGFDAKSAPAVVGMASVMSAFLPPATPESHWLLQGSRNVLDVLAVNVGHATNSEPQPPSQS